MGEDAGNINSVDMGLALQMFPDGGSGRQGRARHYLASGAWPPCLPDSILSIVARCMTERRFDLNLEMPVNGDIS